jgi:glyoxylase-like metal-dependent hydrolase (beta-lactamase superfamily II)
MNDSLSHALLQISAEPPAPGGAPAVAPGILWLRMPLPFALDHINLWLIEEDDGYTLVDCGYGDATTRTHWQRHFETTLAQRPLRRIVVTHCHPDHVGNAAWLAARFGCTVTMTQGEYLTAHALLGGHAGHGAADVQALFARHGMSSEHMAALAARGNRYRRGVPEAPQSFSRIVDDDVLTLGGLPWRVIAGYGHSAEHASLAAADARVLIAGDMLLPRISTNVSVWPGEPDADPVQRFLDSIAAFDTLPPDTLVLPSHNLPFQGVHIRIDELAAHHRERCAEVIEACQRPHSAAELLPIMFRRPLDQHQTAFALGEALAHLHYLAGQGEIERTAGEDGVCRFLRKAA